MSDNRRILVIETSGRVGHVAVALGEKLVGARRLEESRRHARDLTPAVAELCATHGWKVRDLDAVIVTLGPGSYTGLRVGIISAKALAYAIGCKLVGIESFAAIAGQAPVEARIVSVISDAQQKKLYVQRWRREKGGWAAESPLSIMAASKWQAALTPGAWVSGPAVRQWRSSIPAANPIVAEEQLDPTAESLLRLGLERLNQNESDDLWKMEPIYLRPSNAEENWDRLGKKNKRQGETGC